MCSNGFFLFDVVAIESVSFWSGHRGEGRPTRTRQIVRLGEWAAFRTGKYGRIVAGSEPSLEAIEDEGVGEVIKRAIHYVKVGAIQAVRHYHLITGAQSLVRPTTQEQDLLKLTAIVCGGIIDCH